MKNKWILVLLLLVSCTHKAQRKTWDQEKLFPNGIYSQRVQLEVLNKNEVKASFPFSSITRLENSRFEVIGLSPFGTTVFEASGNMEKPEDLNIKFYVKPPDFLKKPFIEKTFAQLNLLYSLKESDLTQRERSDYYKKDAIEMEIFKYNAQSIPSVIKLTSPQWRAYVQTQSYKKLP